MLLTALGCGLCFRRGHRSTTRGRPTWSNLYLQWEKERYNFQLLTSTSTTCRLHSHCTLGGGTFRDVPSPPSLPLSHAKCFNFNCFISEDSVWSGRQELYIFHQLSNTNIALRKKNMISIRATQYGAKMYFIIMSAIIQ